MLDQWQEIHLGDVVKPIQDKWPDRKKWYFDKYIAGGHIESGEVRIKKFGLIKENEKVIGPAFHMRFRPGHVLYSTRRAYLRKAGMVNFEGICSNVTLILQTDESRLLQSLLPFILQSEDFVQFAINHSIGSTNPFVKWTDLCKFKLMLPSFREQKAISNIFWGIENNLEKLDNLILSVEKLKTSLTNFLLTKGIGHSKFRRTELGEIPEEWNISKISDVAEIIMGQSPPGDTYNTNSNGIPLLNGPTEFGIECPTPIQFTTKPTKLCQIDDILLCVRGSTTGRLNLSNGDYCIGRGLAAIRGQNQRANSKWLYYHFIRLQDYIFNIASGGGSTFPNINKEFIEKILIPYPSLEEQHKIVSILTNIDQLIARLKDKKKVTIIIKKGLMQQLLTGKIRVKV